MAIRQTICTFLISAVTVTGALSASYDGTALTPSVYVPSLNISNKFEIDCAYIAARKPFVLFGIGQSLMANTNGENEWGQVTYQNVYEQWNGKCYKANAPLYGATDARKSFMLPLADMIARATSRDVVINMAAIGAKPAEFFTAGNPGGDLISDQIKSMTAVKMLPDVVLFEQGQGDLSTPPAEYRATVDDVLANVRKAGVPAPSFVAIDSVLNWRANPQMVDNHRAIANGSTVFLGPNVDLIRFRRDGTHLDETGLRMQAAMWFQVLAEHFRW